MKLPVRSIVGLLVVHVLAHRGEREKNTIEVAVFAFDGREGLFLASIQQWPMWPGTGHPSEPTSPNIANAVAPEGGSREVWRKAFESLMPRVDAFAPDLIIVSAGFDAHYRDPLASINLKADDFGWVTRKLMDVADAGAQGRIVSVLEGGYDLQGLKESVAAHVSALMGA